MRNLVRVLIPVLILPPIFYGIQAYPVLEKQIEDRRSLVPAYDIARQFAREISIVESRQEGLPSNYGSILAAYGQVTVHPMVAESAGLIPADPDRSLLERLVAKWILWRRKLPLDLLEADPVREIAKSLEAVRLKEMRSAARRQEIVAKHVVDCLKAPLPVFAGDVILRSGLPPGMKEKGIVFCGEKVPIERDDVLRRVRYQLEYLLTDLRQTTKLWLQRRDRYGQAVAGILKTEGIPVEFSLLPALESGYSASATSPSQARGWWQFVRATAVKSLAQDPNLDWTLRVNESKDERCDLILSTRAAARYLTWMRSRLSDSSGPVSWLTVAAAYNAGLNELQYRTAVYKTNSYWDAKLPLETENYVPRWIALWIIDAHRDYYGMESAFITALEFDTLQEIRLSRDLPLSVVAVASNAPLRFIRELNGGVQKGETAFRASLQKDGTAHTIHVPKGCKESVLKTLRERAFLEKGLSEGSGSPVSKKSDVSAQNGTIPSGSQ
jgi:membrane-bound lytic murein transglycosylase D